MHRVFLFHERGVKGNSRCSVAAMATFCLLSACKDAPLGGGGGGGGGRKGTGAGRAEEI